MSSFLVDFTFLISPSLLYLYSLPLHLKHFKNKREKSPRISYPSPADALTLYLFSKLNFSVTDYFSAFPKTISEIAFSKINSVSPYY